MAAGDILSCEVLATGWQAKVIIEGFVDGGAYNFGDIDADVANAKLTMTVVSEGYNASGTLGTKTRYVYGTRVCQKAYPNQATAEETESGGNVELTIALSDYVYDDDNTGAGKSGTAPTVTIASGWYTDSGTGGSSAANNATTALAVTNSSTQDYPKVIARWAVVPYQRFTSTFALEAVAFHRFAESGKPVACVKFTATDGSNTENITATEMSKSAAADSLPCYTASLTASAYTDNAVVTANFTAYPWVGDADSILTSIGGTANALTLGPLPLVADSDDDIPVYVACVNTGTGNDSTGVASTAYATANASPCLTVRGALGKIYAANGSKCDHGVVYLQSNNHSWGDGTGTQGNTSAWVTVTRDPNVLKANACIVGAPNGAARVPYMRVYDVTVKPTGFVFAGVAGRVIWFDAVDVACASQVSTNMVQGFDLSYYTHCTSDQLDYPFAPYSTNSIPSLIRGCAATSALGFAAAAAYTARTTLTSTIEHVAGGLLAGPSADNSIVAYCRDIANPGIGFSADAGSDLAVVCCVLERIGAYPEAFTSFRGGSQSSSTNILQWHNTIAGDRQLTGYNEGASSVTHTGYGLKFNALQYLATKHDVYKLDGTRIQAWSVLYGVGWVGNHSEDVTDTFYPNYAGVRSTHQSSPGYTSDQSSQGTDTGNGDYTPDTGSVLIGKIATAADVVIPWDINGVAYAAGGCAGAITLAGGSILLHAQHYYRLLRG